MRSDEVIELMKDALHQSRRDGQEKIPVETLENFIGRIADMAANSPDGIGVDEAAMEQYKADLSRWVASQQHVNDFNLEMLRSVILTGQTALKSALLINGGAAAALLAFIGGIWNNSNAKPVVQALSTSLAAFVWGVLFAALSSGATYLSQAGYGDEFGRASRAFGSIGRAIAILCVVATYALFAAGALIAYRAFQSAYS